MSGCSETACSAPNAPAAALHLGLCGQWGSGAGSAGKQAGVGHLNDHHRACAGSGRDRLGPTYGVLDRVRDHLAAQLAARPIAQLPVHSRDRGAGQGADVVDDLLEDRDAVRAHMYVDAGVPAVGHHLAGGRGRRPRVGAQRIDHHPVLGRGVLFGELGDRGGDRAGALHDLLFVLAFEPNPHMQDADFRLDVA